MRRCSSNLSKSSHFRTFAVGTGPLYTFILGLQFNYCNDSSLYLLDMLKKEQLNDECISPCILALTWSYTAWR